VRRGPRSGQLCIVAVHSTARGPSLGGCRMWSYADPAAAVADALRLSQAMTVKAAAAGLDQGGGKGVIALDQAAAAAPRDLQREAILLDFAEVVHAVGGRYVTAEDVGTSSADMEIIAAATPHVSGLPVQRGGSGDPSPFTALGVQAAIAACCERVFGTSSMEGRSVAVVGFGQVGRRVAELLAGQGASIIASDIDPAKRAAADALGARWVAPGEAMTAAVDVLAPCALGGVLTRDNVAALRARVIAGAANNQLADDGVASLLAERGILWAPDFVANAGGIINIAVEREPGGYDPELARPRVAAIADTLRDVLAEADGRGITPLAAALARAQRNLV
jgi:leucine dehydrogenase